MEAWAPGSWLRPEAGGLPESWNLTHPEEVKQVYAAYRAAGSDIVETNHLGGSRYQLDPITALTARCP